MLSPHSPLAAPPKTSPTLTAPAPTPAQRPHRERNLL
jgi:hypothetical protein